METEARHEKEYKKFVTEMASFAVNKSEMMIIYFFTVQLYDLDIVFHWFPFYLSLRISMV